MKIIGIVPRPGYHNDQYVLLASDDEIARLVGHTYGSSSEVRGLLKVDTEIPIVEMSEGIARMASTKVALEKLPVTLRSFANIIEQALPPALPLEGKKDAT